ncbi:MAG: hypothetical protein Kow0031_00710 [Anaerolineae bacterium]
MLLVSGCAPMSLELPATGQSAAAEDETVPFPELQPGPELSPAEVVKIQVEALQQNDDEDNGIEVTFRFASPANKQATGPLFRFKEMVKNPTYRAMLNHKLAEYEAVVVDGDSATQRVTIIRQNGEATVFLFSLSRQTLPDCDGCWMTDSVSLVPTRKQQLQGI